MTRLKEWVAQMKATGARNMRWILMIKSWSDAAWSDKALADMEGICNYIVIQLQAPENVMGQYNRIAKAIEGLHIFPERIKLMESKLERIMGLRQLDIDNYSFFM